ncbi:MAG: NrfD/PsrC family molybdoenzyme membrane anchor subunit [Candidatus Rokuibacteriota bacterium]
MEPIILMQHKWSADLFIPSYLFFGGLAAGLFVVAALADLVGLAVPRLLWLSRPAAFTAVPVHALAGFFLTVHLGKPERGLGFPLFFTNYNSWMTRGGWVVGVATLIVIGYAALWYFGVLPRLRRVLAVVGIPVLAFLAIYTGLLLSGAGYVPLWSGKFLPLLFLNSGLTTGVAAAGLVVVAAAWLRRTADGADAAWIRRVLGVALLVLIVAELVELRAFTGYLAEGAPDKALAATRPSGEFAAPMGSRLAHYYLTGGEGYPWALIGGGPATAEAAERAPLTRTLAPWFWIGVVGIGLLLPLLLTLVEWLADTRRPAAAPAVAALKFALVLAGGFMLRTVIVWGGDVKAPLPFPPQLWQVPGAVPLPIPGLGG